MRPPIPLSVPDVSAPSPPEPSAGTPRPSADGTREWTGTFEFLDAMLRQDQAELRREVLLWQRWIRYGAAALFAVAGALMQRGYGAVPAFGWAPLALLVSAYVAAVFSFSRYLTRHPGAPLPAALPGVALALDLTAIALCAWVTLPPKAFWLVLLVGFMVLQLAAFYFGAVFGWWASAATAAIYALGSLVLPPLVPGERPAPATVLAAAATFTFVSAVVVATFGNFRARMNALRQFCKRVEVGDLTVSYDTDREARPDDLTLLARSVDGMRQRLIELVGTDPLTGALNRRALELRLKREWRSARRRDSMLAVLAIDLDNFKPINDTHGHPVGDLVLKELAQIMRETARDTDAIARMGGDEFVLLLPDTGWQGAITFAERLRRQVDAQRFAGEARLPLTISVGIALARGTDDVKATDLLEEADRSLYRAKTGGRNRVGA